MSDGSVEIDIGDIRDEPDTVYAIGVPQGLLMEEVESIQEMFEYQLNHARVVILTLPIEGKTVIEEVELTDLFDEETIAEVLGDEHGSA